VVEEKSSGGEEVLLPACWYFINIFATKMFQENQSEGRAPVGVCSSDSDILLEGCFASGTYFA
jgi:hypothetical protein